VSTRYKDLKDYDVFTRVRRGANLMQIGSFKASDDDLAFVYAKRIYDEEDWMEMQIIRRDNMISVKEPDTLFSKKGVS